MIKILFMCNSCEPGKDGVGDYTRRLVSELILRGYEVQILTLNDSYINNNLISQEIQEYNKIKINVTRCSNLSYNNISIIKKYLKEFNPNLISLQFVIYGFHPKGLPFGLSNKLGFLFKNFKVHIMFHELWVGMEDQAVTKHKIYAQLQKWIIKKIIFKINPKFISTNTQLYKWQLEKLGYAVQLFPLFSNIKNYNLGTKSDINLNIILFGSLHKTYSISKAVDFFYNMSLNEQLKLNFIFLGRNGIHIIDWLTELKNRKFNFEIIGEKTEKEISYFLNSSNIGVVTTPYLLNEKSGVAQAYKEHGLQLYFMDRDWTVSEFETYDENMIQKDTVELYISLLK